MEIHTVSVEEMRRNDAYTIANYVPSKELMFRAGKGIFDSAEWKAPVAVVCGKGNNAGDGYVVALLLHRAGIPCRLFLVSDRFSADGEYYFSLCKNEGVPFSCFESGAEFKDYASVVDCLLGTGFHGEPEGVIAEAIDAINRSGAYVVSADINSGLNGDTGLGTRFVRSSLTVSIGDFKHGHFRGFADEAMRQRVNVDIGIVPAE